MLVASKGSAAMKEKVGEDGVKVSRTASHVRPVRRCLFGDVDHEANRRDLIRIREELAKMSKRRWNFDFENEYPLEGQYQWMSVGPGPLPAVPSTPGPAPLAPSPLELTLADCPPVGCVNFDLSVVPIETCDSTTGRLGINEAAEESAKTRIGQTTLRKYFRVKKRSAHKLRIITK